MDSQVDLPLHSHLSAPFMLWCHHVQNTIMVGLTCSLSLALASASVAWKIGAEKCDVYSHYLNYTTITGFFLQDEASTDPSTFDYVGSCRPTKTASICADISADNC